jgi:hypothetical protein
MSDIGLGADFILAAAGLCGTFYVIKYLLGYIYAGNFFDMEARTGIDFKH